ncbi:MAG: hypothetical protein WDM80_02600 [Limisphaerales bacterium]
MMIKKLRIKSFLVLIIILLSIGFYFFIVRGFLPGGDGIIARINAPDGTEMCVIQTYNGITGEPYTVGFYYHKPGKPWGWFYYEHEDTRWFSGKITLNENGKLAHILCENEEVAKFEIPTESFTISRWKRTVSPAQEWMPEGWKPEDALKPDVLKSQTPKSPMAIGATSNNPPSY